ncbi:sulfhydryl oxidase 1 [Stomoxys calcitrans]|uniref:sulfhydryl oxidase 1 n=1 Tax=Stomoxys calcitrans TaxID=35570 RepID=UPI0027E28DD1|nr:sulfhydryl oxidase 1 [Stomoxys calcitrans]XP_013103926.2 sulfhydryl oxidase 1 [Stomoxys calcitrans]
MTSTLGIYATSAALIAVSLLSAFAYAGVPRSSYEALIKSESQELGLYNHTDKVRVLTDVNFKEEVLERNRSILVEFYNSYCGHCRKFAPTYKLLADELYDWRDVVPISAIDCAADENNGICRDYEVMAYPTLRYFGPGYAPSPDNYGIKILTQVPDEIRSLVAEYVAAENKTSNMTSWPDLKPLQAAHTVSTGALFDGLDSLKKFVVIVYEPENTTIGIETALHFVRYPNIAVKRTSNLELAGKYQIDGSRYRIATVSRQGSIVPYGSLHETSLSYKETIESFLKSQHLTEKPPTNDPSLTRSSSVIDEHENAKIIEEVRRNKHMVYQADLEMAVRGTLYNEIPKSSHISGEKLLALQRFLGVLENYNPLGSAGRKMIKDLSAYTKRHTQELSGEDFEKELKRLEDEHGGSAFSSKRYIGCIGSKTGLRGFTCSLWQLFHFMTVQAATSDKSEDPLEVLQAMHGYVKHFFGCTECSKHFQEMAMKRNIWNNPTKDEAVLWLWAAHNEVNQRLSGDETDDPKFPKIQFPSTSSCSQCRKDTSHSVPSAASQTPANWDKDHVLQFLKNIHNPEFISRYGVDNHDILPPTLEKMRQKRMISSVFSDMDMGMGMLLYGFCIVMLVVAFKLFAMKKGGYRKKPYAHNLLGKV